MNIFSHLEHLKLGVVDANYESLLRYLLLENQSNTQDEQSDNGSDQISIGIRSDFMLIPISRRIPGCGPTFGSLVLESDGNPIVGISTEPIGEL